MIEEEIEQKLDNLRFKSGSVNEVILTTVNADGSANAAPMGVLRIGGKNLEIKPFKASTTYANLLRCPRACINITDDPALFLVTAFKDECFEGIHGHSIDEELRLDPSDAYIFINVVDTRDVSEVQSSFTCLVSSVEVTQHKPRVFSRGRSMTIEAIIYATRIEVFVQNGWWERVERLIKHFNMCKDVVSRVSTLDSTEVRIIQALERLIESWRESASR